jgi:uncharacterized SAM-binding protein YcdF (DUF218 family)
MVERILILLLLALVIAAGWGLLRLWRRTKLHALRGETPLAGVVPAGRTAVVAFSTPNCAECHTRQAPALARLATALGDSVTVRSLSALEHPEIVRQIGILTVPATIVLDRDGYVRSLNLGYASAERLRDQVASVGG